MWLCNRALEGKVEMKNIVVTGATGSIAQEFLSLSKGNYNIFALHRTKQFEKEKFVSGERIRYIYTDYSDVSLDNILKKCDVILHLAAQKVSRELTTLASYFSSIELHEKIMLAAKRNDVKKIIVASSRCVYSDLNTLPFKENEYPIPTNVYGASKVAMESLSEFYRNSLDMTIVTVRLSQVISRNLSDNTLIPIAIRNVLENKDISVFGKGLSVRDYIYIKDVVCGLEAIIESENVNGIVNLGSGVGISIVEAVELISKLNSEMSSIKFIPVDKEDCSKFVLDMSIMKEKVGFYSNYTFEEMIKDIVLENETEF